MGGKDLVIAIDVAMIGAEVTDICKNSKSYKKEFRKTYRNPLNSIYVSAIGATDAQVVEKFMDGCSKLTVASDDASAVWDTAAYGLTGTIVSFKMSTEDATLRNVFKARYPDAFVAEFNRQLAMLFDAVVVDDSRTSESSKKGSISPPSDSTSDAKKMSSIWLFPALLLMVASMLFMFQTRTFVDPDGSEEQGRVERMRAEVAQFEKKFGAVILDEANGLFVCLFFFSKYFFVYLY